MSANIAEILRGNGFVPVVPELSRRAGTPQTLAPQRVPAVPVVPVENHKGKRDPAEILAHLLRLADGELIDAGLVRRLSESDLLECIGLPDATLRAYLHALNDSALRQVGKVPRDETACGLCRHCGPVWLAPEIAAVAPMVNGWPVVLGCPWCHVRERALIPRPIVHCRDCTHFVRDTVNPAEGMGRCAADREPMPKEPMPYPHAARECERFESGR